MGEEKGRKEKDEEKEGRGDCRLRGERRGEKGIMKRVNGRLGNK